MGAPSRFPYIAAGETKQVQLTISKDMLMFTGMDRKRRFESGWFTVTVEKLSAHIHIRE